MMLKLSLTGVKKRWQDYLVLLLGLVISVAIFYMFQTVALNEEFLVGNIPQRVKMVSFVFQLGSVLLGIVTVVYIFYANSFLLSMRKKEYGMYMLLGAKKRKISQMIGLETLIIGLSSLVIGSGIGYLLAYGVGGYLSQLIDLPVNTYVPMIPKAVLLTVAYFSILFMLTTLINIIHFNRSKTIDLLYSEQTSERHKKQPIFTAFKFIVSVTLIGIGYYCLINIRRLQLNGVGIAIFTITPGTFLFFNSVFPTVVASLKNWQGYSRRKLKVFTLSQLSFKAKSLSRVLGLVAMLMALALGAVTVGQSFSSLLDDMLKQFPNDVVSYNPTEELKKEFSALDKKTHYIYHLKYGEDQVFYNEEELHQQPLLVTEMTEGETIDFTKPMKEISVFNTEKAYSYENPSAATVSMINGFMMLSDNYGGLHFSTHRVLTADEFSKQSEKSEEVHVLRTENFRGSISSLKKIDELERNRSTAEYPVSSAKLDIYEQTNSMGSGFMFMGFFLGIAFLAMLASCLMFKVLSGAYQDVARYDMLRKIGVRRALLKQSLAKEIGVIFAVPAILGIVHVLVGLKMFSVFFSNPYAYIVLPFTVFGIIYFVYYLVTVMLYKRIVLAK